MRYEEAIEWLREDGYKKDDGTFYEFGEVRFFRLNINIILLKILTNFIEFCVEITKKVIKV